MSLGNQAKKLADRLPKHKMIMDPKSYRMVHPVYQSRDIEIIEKTHMKPSGFRDWCALSFVRVMRGGFDLVSGYNE